MSKKAPWFDDQVKEVPRAGRKRHLRDKDEPEPSAPDDADDLSDLLHRVERQSEPE